MRVRGSPVDASRCGKNKRFSGWLAERATVGTQLVQHTVRDWAVGVNHDAAARMCNQCHIESDEEISTKIKTVASKLEEAGTK